MISNNYGFMIIMLSLLETLSIFANKYILTVLGFQFPMVFQGWQTLVGFVILYILRNPKYCHIYDVNPLDKPGFVSLLPNFLFFTTSIISGSKALAQIPVLIFITLTNSIPSLIHLFVDANRILRYNLNIFCSMGTIITSLIIFIYECGGSPLAFAESPYFWILIHIICNVAIVLHGRIADARYEPVDKLYYSYVFSLVVLAPASFYLEESFQALHFQHRKQIRFILGSVFSAVVGVALNLYLNHSAFNPKNTDTNRSKWVPSAQHHVGLVIAALVSIFTFDDLYLPWWGWFFAILNLLFFIYVPSHFKADEIVDMKLTASQLNNQDNEESVTDLLIVPN